MAQDYFLQGSCVAYLTRGNVQNMADVTVSEVHELFSDIIPNWHKAVNRSVGPAQSSIHFPNTPNQQVQALLTPVYTQGPAYRCKREYGLRQKTRTPDKLHELLLENLL